MSDSSNSEDDDLLVGLKKGFPPVFLPSLCLFYISQKIALTEFLVERN